MGCKGTATAKGHLPAPSLVHKRGQKGMPIQGSHLRMLIDIIVYSAMPDLTLYTSLLSAWAEDLL